MNNAFAPVVDCRTSCDDMQASSIPYAFLKEMRDLFVLKQLMGIYPVLDVRSYNKREG